MVKRIRLYFLTLVMLTACSAAEPQTPTPAIAVTIHPTSTLRSTPQPAATAALPTATVAQPTVAPADTPAPQPEEPHPLSIEAMRQRQYPGSDIVIEQTLAPGSNYNRYYVSYLSEGLKIYALLTVPRGKKPETGWPVVVFNHGFIPPDVYKTTERYIAYVDAFARNGYIVLRSDYRGHDQSEGEPTGAYGSPGYVVDVLNAVASVKRYPDSDPNRIGMWGHSMGGYITLRSMVINKDIKAGVIWAGVIGSYQDLIERWRRRNAPPPGGNDAFPATPARRWRQTLMEQYGTPEENPEFWASISANSYLSDLSGPVQLHHGTADTSVPIEFSDKLNEEIKAVGVPVEYFTYPGDNHNISNNLSRALTRSVQFFNKYVKGQ
jgi:dipeptidyl aminopeptidase/acylaminoacyl peptidase